MVEDDVVDDDVVEEDVEEVEDDVVEDDDVVVVGGVSLNRPNADATDTPPGNAGP